MWIRFFFNNLDCLVILLKQCQDIASRPTSYGCTSYQVFFMTCSVRWCSLVRMLINIRAYMQHASIRSKLLLGGRDCRSNPLSELIMTTPPLLLSSPCSRHPCLRVLYPHIRVMHPAHGAPASPLAAHNGN
ncbi:hypothetical protein HBI56_058570 [Parastagonospora nodorum]|uniref:Uncharacterized protein n=1 Tax=Phaeosphaeria nodorum (strain SN15 / ATCC MYA-4574 / FGSC 10173) TaxID=321614 RepID=A0A7U2F632_PHANO|nr:hypothetical protein HBH56_160070 [Parastagonospora nodorum]QRC97249.1 hypothetical protein JI435_410350 [Parastagonospora nodorum SN15]KAH3922412.1 hypothetical protein HBH54_224500 [Parastagonospora nodorum]KAH3947013.1 hypothetical protein HBH53_121840 [Parastagonospora nodorum]KAH3969731.1 hypothetical protein HBH52_169850 [Parastagonospora nodorum]